MTNETFCGNRHIYLGFSIFVLIKLDFMGIFQDEAFPNLEYQLFGKVGKCPILEYFHEIL